jgi:MFS family permease
VSKDEVGKYMGTAMSCNNFGIILSPLLGGVLYKAAGRMAVFGVMMGLSGIDIALRLTMQENKAQAPHLSDRSGQPGHEMVCVEKGMLEHNPYQQTSTPTSSSSSLDSTTSQSNLLKGEIQKEITVINKGTPEDVTRSPKPSPTTRFAGILKLIRSPRLLVALYGCFINECIIASLCAVLPLFVHETFHWTSLQAGCLFLTIAIPGLAGPLAGMLGDRLGPRWVSVAGFLLTAPSLMALRFVEKNSTEQIVLLCALLTLAGKFVHFLLKLRLTYLGSAIIFFLSPLGADLTFVADEVSEALDMDMYASSFSLMNSALAAAGVLGPLFVGWLQNEFGWKATSIALGALCLSGAAPCVSGLLSLRL